jgi:uncharacterized protein YndB with AHSA1/START domain
MTEELGVYRSEGESVALRFQRAYDATPEEVWDAVTEPESIRRWLFAEAVVEPRVGGVFQLVWSDEESAGGAVLSWEPPSLLEVEWNEGESRTILRIEIVASNGGAVLVLDHRNLTVDIAVGLGAGWHSHLEALGEALAGREVSEERWHPRYVALRPEYEAIVSAR